MKNLKIKTAFLFLIAINCLFTACNKDEITEPLSASESLQSKKYSYKKHLPVADAQGNYKAQLLVHTDQPEVLNMIERHIVVRPIYEKSSKKKGEENYKKVDESRKHPDYVHQVDIEILSIGLPENALGYAVEFRGSGDRGKMGTWLYTLTATNRKKGIIDVYDGSVITWNEYTMCHDEENTYISNSPELEVGANGNLSFPTTPDDVACNRVSVEYDPGIDFFTVDFEDQGTCLKVESCGWTETNEPLPPPVCCSLTNENPVSVRTLQKASAFSQNELQPVMKEATRIIIKHRIVLDDLMTNDLEILEAVDLFLNKNTMLFENGFTNDYTIIGGQHIEPALALLELFESKVSEKELKQYFRKIHSAVKKMKGKELKTALKSLETKSLK